MPRASREKSEATRSHIVEAAYQLFIERGYHGTSMRDVGREAGLTVGAIYNHFPNKEDLWKEVLFERHPYHEIIPILEAVQGTTLSEMVRSAARALVDELQKHPDLLNLMFVELVEFRGSHFTELFQKISPQVFRIQEAVAGKQGLLRDIPPVVLLRSFLGLFFSYYMTGIFLPTQPGLTIDPQSLDQFVNVYLFGILADEDPSRLVGLKPFSTTEISRPRPE